MQANDARAWLGRGAMKYLLVVLLAGLAAPVWAVAPPVDEDAIEGLWQALDGPVSVEPPVMATSEAGYVYFLGAPPRGKFLVRHAKSGGDAEALARAFLQENAGAFALENPAFSLEVININTFNTWTFVRFQQYYDGIKVLGAQLVVHLDADGNVLNATRKTMEDTQRLDTGSLGLTPSLQAAAAEQAAVQALGARHSGLAPGQISSLGDTELVLYHPPVLGKQGATRLAWFGTAASSEGTGQTDLPVAERLLIDAHDSSELLHYTIVKNALDRQIWDARNVLMDRWYNIADFRFYFQLGWIAREEGDPVANITDVDNCYDMFGGAYDYFYEHFNRDSFDGNGASIVANVRQPYLNAYFASFSGMPHMVFGAGFVADDIVCHELTHGVTDSIVDFFYFSDSGALSEMYSDLYGEFVDLSNGIGNDSPEVRWVLGEDIAPVVRALIGSGNRYMKDPTFYYDPDRRGHPNYYQDGEVHRNAGPGDKLIYLLTDGDLFNSYRVEGIGMERVADLYWTALYLLTSAATYEDLARALGAAATSFDYDYGDRLNVAKGVRAVEIEPTTSPIAFQQGLRNFRAAPTRDRDGHPVIALNWENPKDNEFAGVWLQRSTAGYLEEPSQSARLANGTMTQYLDRNVQPGVEYFYTLIATMDYGLPQIASTRAVADAPAEPRLTQIFGFENEGISGEPFDLDYSTLILTPAGPPAGEGGETVPITNLNDYEVTVIPNVLELPVPREDERGGAISLPLANNRGISLGLFQDTTEDEDVNLEDSPGMSLFLPGTKPLSSRQNTFPFFGKNFLQVFVGANGYLTFQSIDYWDDENHASLASHFALPRISFLFSRLAPSQGGEIWARQMVDRVVVTFDGVPQFVESSSYAPQQTNTVQVELFFSGHIHITYLEVGANDAIVGISDGKGIPADPADLFSDLESLPRDYDFSDAPAEPERLSINPITPPTVTEGDVIDFEVTTQPEGATPFLSATWNSTAAVPFADNGGGMGVFHWETGLQDSGVYIVRVRADLEDEVAFQDVRVTVGNFLPLPYVERLGIATEDEADDPEQSRGVSSEEALSLRYTYRHEELEGNADMYGEGDSLVYWMRNGQVVSTLTSKQFVPPEFTMPGDEWYFVITPVTKTLLAGEPVQSPTVTVSGIPTIEEVIPSFGLVSGGETVRIVGRLLDGALAVEFGGVRATRVRVIDDTELEVTTPLYTGNIAADPELEDLVDVVDVVVRTAAGPGVLPSGYTYKALEDTPVPNGEKEGGPSCGATRTAGGPLTDMTVVLAAALALAAFSRRKRVLSR